jgi:hypothetical protein
MATYVAITRDEFEEFLNTLNTTPQRPAWVLKDNTAGVYLLHVEKSERVAIRVSTSIGRHDEVVGVGKGAIHFALVSQINGSVLNKKAAGQSRVNRTQGWRKNCTKVIKNIVSAYLKASDFYEAIADREAYKSAVTGDIEAFPGWENHPELKNLHTLVSNGNIMNFRQRELLIDILDAGPAEEIARPQPKSEPITTPDQDFLAKLRRLYVAVKGTSSESFVASIGKQYKERGSLSPKQRDVIEQMFSRNRISSRLSSLHLRWGPLSST